MDIIFVRDLTIDAVIGVFDWERQVAQKISIDLEMGTSISHAAKTDALDDTLDYKAISKCIQDLVAENRPQLVETLIELIAQTIMSRF